MYLVNKTRRNNTETIRRRPYGAASESESSKSFRND